MKVSIAKESIDRRKAIISELKITEKLMKEK